MLGRTAVSYLRKQTQVHILKRGFADQVAQGSEKLKLSFATPTSALRKDASVDMVVFPAATGMMGVLPQHVPTVAQLKPGVVTVIEEGKEDKYFVSSGFAFVTQDRTDILAVEAVRLEDLDKEAVQRGLSECESAINSASDEVSQAIAQIGVEVHSAMKSALES
ncbi:ATP synthase subunit delta', mitochondrial [Galdieria sulphuraria]|uniref:F-type H+-transporting ATPase subunit delta n=1 Tax=Galdieria sulphuraria TaxID=130081 RepID=M2VWZ2_GALSU|nr:F-type H+-transporting ATPase subunit delta [Galdieria sulphuraria]EME27771.1 F-type H+-transporting ATPase subunit delta [Galdieria sulphuraria]GJD10186.1 ATP synthase subunit delta', mitochondrial [Galdieria sulphuraria]|eukprot:XP_005704291.1 F-type H+-transporting ATPase subunit delta [Galdieria sulphuraria]